MYLVDTNVISAGAPTKVRPLSTFTSWMDQNSDRIYVSVVTIMEIEDGIAKAKRIGASRKAGLLAAWLDAVTQLYGNRILPFDRYAAQSAGRLSDLARGRGLGPGFADLAIAGTALHRGYTVLTRNLRHFAAIDVPARDPFSGMSATDP